MSWFMVGHFVYFLHTWCVQTAKALARLRRCAGSPEPSLVAYVISTIISWVGSIRFWQQLLIFHSMVCWVYKMTTRQNNQPNKSCKQNISFLHFKTWLKIKLNLDIMTNEKVFYKRYYDGNIQKKNCLAFIIQRITCHFSWTFEAIF